MFTFVETTLFTRLIQEYLSDGEYMELQSALAENPEAGRIFKGSGGIRKLRWAVSGKGKRGGLRIIYYLKTRQEIIWMLTVYPKSVAETIPAHILRQILKEMEDVGK